MTVVGIDPGMGVTGIAVLSYNGSTVEVVHLSSIKTEPKSSLEIRLKSIFQEIYSVCKKYKPDVMVVEKVFVHKQYPKSSIILSHARACAFISAGLLNIKTFEIDATSAKKGLTSTGRATKKQITSMASYFLKNADFKNEHIADAASMALNYILKKR